MDKKLQTTITVAMLPLAGIGITQAVRNVLSAVNIFRTGIKGTNCAARNDTDLPSQ